MVDSRDPCTRGDGATRLDVRSVNRVLLHVGFLVHGPTDGEVDVP